MSNYAKGAKRERDVQHLLEQRGWWVCRAAGSKGEADLVAMKDGCPTKLLEIKATRTPFSGFPPADRADLLRAAARAGAVPELVWWPPDRGGPRWLPGPDTWPPTPTIESP